MIDVNDDRHLYYGPDWSSVQSGTLQSLWPALVQGSRVVELGAASGRNSALLPDGATYVGLEYNEDLLQDGRAAGRDLRFCDLTDPNSLKVHSCLLKSADTLLLLDVIEHLPSPVGLLAMLHAMLPMTVRVIVSVPNVTFVSSRLVLASGHFPRRPSGIFDRTHLRFFDRDAIEREIVVQLGDRECTVWGAAKTVNGAKLGRLPAGAFVVRAAQRTATIAARYRPTLFAYEWLIVAGGARS